MKKRTIPALRLKVSGPGVVSGRIRVPDLIRICQETQAAVKRQAEAIEGRKTMHPGPVAANIQEECTLELIAIKRGSTTLDFDFAKPQLQIQEVAALGREAISELVAGIKSLGNGNKRNIDPGVLQSVYNISAVAESKRITGVHWIAPAGGRTAGGKAKKPITALMNSTVRERAALRLSSPRLVETFVDGVLDMADFKPEDHKCRIDPAIGVPVLCTFNADLADRVQQLLRKTVRGAGTAKLAPYTNKIEVVELKSIEPLPSIASGKANFFQDSTLLELATLQRTKPLKDPSELAGAIPADTDVDVFLDEIYEARK